MATTTVTETVTAQPITAQHILRLFPDIDTSGDALDGHDEEQIRLMDEVCIVTDENDVPIGKASKKICRRSAGEVVHVLPRRLTGRHDHRSPHDEHRQGPSPPRLLRLPV